MNRNRVGKNLIILIAVMMFMTPFSAYAKTKTKSLVKPKTVFQKQFPEIVLKVDEEPDLMQKIIDSEKEFVGYNQENGDESVEGSFVKIPAIDEESIESKQESTLLTAIKDAARDVYELQVEQTDKPTALLKDRLTHHFEKGPLDSLQFWSGYQMNFSNTLPERGHNMSKFDMAVINLTFDGKFKGKKEGFRVMFEPSHHPKNSHFLQMFFQDVYLESNRIPHTNLAVGHFRPGVGVEGASSAYILDFITRSQIARNLSNARKLGFKVSGDYSLMDYNAGVYSSGTHFSDFFPGHEVDAWMNVKPLGKTKGKYGKLVTGAGVQSGEKHGISYYMTGAYASYEYKKFKTKFEYARANGSNGGSGLTNARSQGFYWTTAYKITPKIELVGRFDQFDPNRYTRNNNNREYTAGVNYYIKGQGLRLIFNYIYGQNDSKSDSHKLMVGTQIML